MNAKNVIVAGLVGAVVFFLLGWLLYGMLLMGFFQANAGSATGVMKEMPNLGLIFLGNLASGILVAYIFDKWAGIRTFGSGLKAGAWLGLLFGATSSFISLGTANVLNSTAAIVDIGVMLVMYAIAGGIIAAVLGAMNKSSSS